MNNITAWKNELIKAALFAEPSATPWFTADEFAMANSHLAGRTLNGTARDLEIYLKDTTLRVTLFGWALQLPRAEVQQVASQFFTQLKTMLEAERSADKNPINAVLEPGHRRAERTPLHRRRRARLRALRVGPGPPDEGRASQSEARNGEPSTR